MSKTSIWEAGKMRQSVSNKLNTIEAIKVGRASERQLTDQYLYRLRLLKQKKQRNKNK